MNRRNFVRTMCLGGIATFAETTLFQPVGELASR